MPSTWGGRSKFTYTGSVATGTEITFGRGWKVRVSAHDYAVMRRHFLGRIVNIGTSRTEPPDGSLGAWIQETLGYHGIACYVGPILLLEGYARRVGEHDIYIIR